MTEPVRAPTPTPMRSPVTQRFMLQSPFCSEAEECDRSSQPCGCSTISEDVSSLIVHTRSTKPLRFKHVFTTMLSTLPTWYNVAQEANCYVSDNLSDNLLS